MDCMEIFFCRTTEFSDTRNVARWLH
jgi:hypothetical protein